MDTLNLSVMSEQPNKRPFSELSPVKTVTMSEQDMAAMMKDLMPSLIQQGLKAVGLDTIKQDLQSYGLDTLKNDLAELKDSVNFAHKTGEEAKSIATECRSDILVLQTELEQTKQQLTQEHDARLKLEYHSRRNNLKFYGVPEEDGETWQMCEHKILKIINLEFRLNVDNMPMERCHRVGMQNKASKQPRPIIAKFSFYKDRNQVWETKSMMTGRGRFVKEDYPPEIEKKRDVLFPIFTAAKNMKKKNHQMGRVKLAYDKLYIGSEVYTADALDKLPADLHPAKLATRSNENAVWFYRKESPLSNHYISPFMENNIQYNCSEQYLMVNKARVFKDPQAAAKIMQLDNPVQQKQVRISNFNQAEWHKVAPDIMKKALMLKFSQNEKLKRVLLDTETKLIAEASPSDSFWGCGHSLNSREVSDPSMWTGNNALGKALMEVRSDLK